MALCVFGASAFSFLFFIDGEGDFFMNRVEILAHAKVEIHFHISCSCAQ